MTHLKQMQQINRPRLSVSFDVSVQFTKVRKTVILAFWHSTATPFSC